MTLSEPHAAALAACKYEFEHIPGFFSVTDWDMDIDNRFGLCSSLDWRTFAAAIQDLQANAPTGDVIKVLFTARHGEAEHNVLAAKYGLPDGDQLAYPITDPNLTEVGRQQARRLAVALQHEYAHGMPLPTRWFVSSMRRPGETCGLEWGWVFPGKRAGEGDMGHGVPAQVVEELREHLHVHHCDERLPRRQLAPLFPTFRYPPDMPDDDTVWKPASVRGRETEDEMVERAGRGLSIVFDECRREDTYVSLTAHSGVLRAVYKNLRVPPRRLVTGEMMVLVIRGRLR